jgi:hypothetical protein
LITIQQKRFLRKPLTIVHNSWDECSQTELIELFRILESPWYKEESRLLIGEFIGTPEISQAFPIKKIKKLFGPDYQLRTMTFGQWAFIERKMFDLSQNNCNETVQSLMACLFIEKFKRVNRFISVGKTFTPEMVKENQKLFKGLPKHYLNAIVRCWDAQRRWCYSLYPYVFPKTASTEKVQSTAPEYVKIMRNFAGSPADSDVEKIFNSNVHSILSALNDELKPKKKK